MFNLSESAGRVADNTADETINPVLRYAPPAVAARDIFSLLVFDEWEKQRMLLATAGEDRIELVRTVTDMLSLLCHSQPREHWAYYALSNEGFYMAPQSALRYRLRTCAAHLPHVLDARSAGLVATAMASTRLTFDLPGVHLSQAYVLLSRFIHQQPDGPILRAILDDAPA